MGSLNTQEESYVRLANRRRRRRRGFRLCPRNRFSVRRLRAELLTFLGLVGRYVRILVRRLSKGGVGGGGGANSSSSCGRSGSRRVLVGAGKDANNKAPPRRAPSFMRSNSFYSEAIADCLEFIKRNSVPVEDYGSVSARRYSS